MIKKSIRIFKYILIIFYSFSGYAQPGLPQRSVTLYAAQALDFGKFYDEGSGGSITVGLAQCRSIPLDSALFRLFPFHSAQCRVTSILELPVNH